MRDGLIRTGNAAEAKQTAGEGPVERVLVAVICTIQAVFESR